MSVPTVLKFIEELHLRLTQGVTSPDIQIKCQPVVIVYMSQDTVTVGSLMILKALLRHLFSQISFIFGRAVLAKRLADLTTCCRAFQSDTVELPNQTVIQLIITLHCASVKVYENLRVQIGLLQPPEEVQVLVDFLNEGGDVEGPRNVFSYVNPKEFEVFNSLYSSSINANGFVVHTSFPEVTN